MLCKKNVVPFLLVLFTLFFEKPTFTVDADDDYVDHHSSFKASAQTLSHTVDDMQATGVSANSMPNLSSLRP